MSEYVEVLINHTHTPYSIESSEEYLGERVENHVADYPALVERLDREPHSGIAPIFVRTEHYDTDPSFFEEDLPTAVEEEYDGEYEEHDAHVTGEIGDTPFAVINGVEASVGEGLEDGHMTIAGLPIDDDASYADLSFDDVYDVAREAEWAAPAHPMQVIPSVLDTGWSEDDLDLLYNDLTDERGVTLAIESATGYDPFTNAISRGALRSLQGRKHILDYAEKYDLQVIGAWDWHVSMPEGLEGANVPHRQSAFRDIEKGDIPAEKLLNSDIVSYSSWNPLHFTEGGGYVDSLWRTFPYNSPVPNGIVERFAPHDEETYSAAMEDSLDRLVDLDADTLVRNQRDPKASLL